MRRARRASTSTLPRVIALIGTWTLIVAALALGCCDEVDTPSVGTGTVAQQLLNDVSPALPVAQGTLEDADYCGLGPDAIGAVPSSSTAVAHHPLPTPDAASPGVASTSSPLSTHRDPPDRYRLCVMRT